MDATTYPPKDKVHALILAMSAELEILRTIAEADDPTLIEIAIREKRRAARATTQAAALAVGCRPDGPLNS